MRERLYEIIEVADRGDRLSRIYDWVMMVCIVASLVPLAFKGYHPRLLLVDKVCVIVFIVDYLLRLLTADYKYRHLPPAVAFVRYPFSFLALIDLLAILPSLTMLNNSFKLLRILLMARSLRVLRAFKALRYSKSVRLLLNVFRNSKDPLITVGTLAVAYVVISALVIFNVEPQSFDTFFDAIYWAAVTLTTVGYGDIYPVTAVGRTIAVVSSVFGVAIVALPAGILTAGYMNELSRERQDREQE